MIVVKSKALNEELKVEREIGSYSQNQPGPTVIITAGIHGNEPSGIFALNRVLPLLNKLKPTFKGQIIAFCGNITALSRGERYIQNDLNRLWDEKAIKKLHNGGFSEAEKTEDIEEQIELFKRIKQLLKNSTNPIYFIDLHTTSAPSLPFITMNDTMRNRTFALRFPVPTILGIEEFLDGTLLGYLNELGHISVGFEAGSHDAADSIDNHEACLWLALAAAGCMEKRDIPGYDRFYQRLKEQSNDSKKIFEIRYRYNRTEQENFKMLPGFENFQPIKNAQHLANNNLGQLTAKERGRIFLPLYQNKGNDGYFIIREIKMFWLNVSAWLRRFNSERFIRFLPGIYWQQGGDNQFKVSKKIARWLVVDFFHLMGFRRSNSTTYYHYFRRRPYDNEEPPSPNL